MKHCVAAFVSIGIGVLNVCHAQAQVTNLDDKVKALLVFKGKVPYTHKVKGCVVTEQVNLTASNITAATESSVKFGERKDTPLKEDSTIWAQQYINCGAGKGSLALSVSRQVVHTVTGTLTKQAALAIGGTIGLSGGIPLFAKITGSLTLTYTGTKISAIASALAETDMRTGTGTQEVPSKAKVDGQFIVYPVKVDIPFTYTGTLDEI